MANSFTADIVFGPFQFGTMTPDSPGVPFRTIQVYYGPYISVDNVFIPENSANGTLVGTASIANIADPTGWAFTETSDPDSVFAINSSTGAITKNAGTFDYDTGPTYHDFAFQATKGGQTTLTWSGRIYITNVFEAANLSALSFSGTLTQNASSPITIGNRTLGSALSVVDAAPAGMTLNSGAGTITGSPTTLGSGTTTIRETLADSANSPRDTVWNWTVNAASNDNAVTYNSTPVTYNGSAVTYG